MVNSRPKILSGKFQMPASFKWHTALSSMKNLYCPSPSHLGQESSLCPVDPLCVCCSAASCSVAVWVRASLLQHPGACAVLCKSWALCDDATTVHLTSSHHVGIVSSHPNDKKKEGECQTLRYFERDRPHSLNFHYHVLLYSVSFIVNYSF
jgi:hypothetical protein